MFIKTFKFANSEHSVKCPSHSPAEYECLDYYAMSKVSFERNVCCQFKLLFMGDIVCVLALGASEGLRCQSMRNSNPGEITQTGSPVPSVVILTRSEVVKVVAVVGALFVRNLAAEGRYVVRHRVCLRRNRT